LIIECIRQINTLNAISVVSSIKLIDYGCNVSVIAEDLKITFKAIQDLTVDAGTYKVFRMDFSTRFGIPENQSSNLNANMDLTGQSYLEQDTCKQVQSTLQINMVYQFLGIPLSMEGTITSILTQDLRP